MCKSLEDKESPIAIPMRKCKAYRRIWGKIHLRVVQDNLEELKHKPLKEILNWQPQATIPTAQVAIPTGQGITRLSIQISVWEKYRRVRRQELLMQTARAIQATRWLWLQARLQGARRRWSRIIISCLIIIVLAIIMGRMGLIRRMAVATSPTTTTASSTSKTN